MFWSTTIYIYIYIYIIRDNNIIYSGLQEERAGRAAARVGASVRAAAPELCRRRIGSSGGAEGDVFRVSG